MSRQQEGYAGQQMGQQAGDGGAEESLTSLLGQLTRQGSSLAQQQLELIQAEVRESANDVKAAVGSMLGAAVVGIAGLGVVLMGLSYLLADVFDDSAGAALGNTGLATLIVGLVTLLIAYFLYKAGSKKMSAAHLSPERSRRTLERTPDAVRGDLTTESPR